LKEEAMKETYTFYPPQMRATRMAYDVAFAGAKNCEHELLEAPWKDRLSVVDGVIFIQYTCKHCGRQIRQSLDEVMPPASWKGRNSEPIAPPFKPLNGK
jgi:hypothetical protein